MSPAAGARLIGANVTIENTASELDAAYQSLSRMPSTAAPPAHPRPQDQHTSIASRHLTHPTYRPDIDGLRAIAVLSVVGFHAFPHHFRGGFVGVDVFFVISGFLISTIIYTSLEQDRFSFVEFYTRRIRRIFPALLVVLAACLAVGWFSLLADEYRQLGKHIAAGAGFVANFALWNESGYFDNAAETKPLLHLWSLGIEEQFYILWPFLLWIGWRRRTGLVSITMAIVAISFLLNIVRYTNDPIGTFYSPLTRFWELLTGSLLAYFALHAPKWLEIREGAPSKGSRAVTDAALLFRKIAAMRDAQSIVGVLLIAASIGMLSEKSPFPGFLALLPTVGAALVISGGPRAWVNRTMLAHPALVWFGLISFPLYLWHWPLLSFARIVESGPVPTSLRMALVAVSIALAWATTTLVERPLRFGGNSLAKGSFLAALMLIVGLTGWVGYIRNGWEFRLNDREEYLSFFENSLPNQRYFQRINLDAAWRAECAFFDVAKYRQGILEGTTRDSRPRPGIDKSCFERDRRLERSVLIWGDSHAQALGAGVKANMPSGWQVLQVATSGCAPSLSWVNPDRSQCDASNRLAVQTVDTARPDVVLVAQVRGHDARSFDEIADRLISAGVRKVIFAGPTPQWNTDLPRIIARRFTLTPRRIRFGLKRETFESNDELVRSFHQDRHKVLANLISLFCDADGCMTYIGSDKKLGITTFDYGHLTPSASDFAAKNLLINMIINAE